MKTVISDLHAMNMNYFTSPNWQLLNLESVLLREMPPKSTHPTLQRERQEGSMFPL